MKVATLPEIFPLSEEDQREVHKIAKTIVGDSWARVQSSNITLPSFGISSHGHTSEKKERDIRK